MPLIQCQLRLDRAAVSYGGSYRVTGILTAMSETVRIYQPLAWGKSGFRVWMTRDDGASFTPPFQPQTVQPSTFEDAGSYRRILKGQSIESAFAFDAIGTFFRTCANNRMHLSYMSPVPRALAPAADTLTTEHGAFEAQAVESICFTAK